jgi:ABC-type transport system involved in multi-copper enzyme maturation permease subunit
MPIHDQGYRRYAGTRAALGRGWTVIARNGVKALISKRVFLGIMLMAWSPFVVRAVQIYVASNFAQAAAILGVKAETFREFLEQQNLFVFFVTIYVGAGLIANDRRANALQVYLAKPLTRAEYVAGKLAILFLFLVAVTWAPAISLLIVQIMFAGSFTFLRENIFLLPAITLFSLLQVLLASMTMLALSSLSKSSRFVGIMYAGLMFFTSALFNAVRGITGSSSLAWLSPNAALEQIGDVIFRLQPRYDLPAFVAILVIVTLIALSGVILERRVRGVEIVQ